MPLYDQDLEEKGFPDPVKRVVDTLRGADGIYFACPEFNYSIPGTQKNLIDWVTRLRPCAFAGKPIAIVSAAASFSGGARCQHDLRKILSGQGCHVMASHQVFVPQNYLKFDKELNLTCEETRKALKDQVQAFAQWIDIFKRQ